MSFTLEGIPKQKFQHLDDFFLNGTSYPKLFEDFQIIQHPLVEIYSYEWYFDGIRMGYSDWKYKESAELAWAYEMNANLITFHANIHGAIYVENKDQPHQIFGDYQHNLSFTNETERNRGFLKSNNLQTSMFFIQFTKDAFLRLTGDANESLNFFGQKVLEGKTAVLAKDNLPINAYMLSVIGNILNCPFKDGLKKMYLLSKSIEFLVLQAEACNAALQPKGTYIKTKYDEKCIAHAHKYIMNHLEDPPSLSELAQIIGINEYKLKRGFKETYGNTVFGYLSEARLEIAKNLILEQDKSIGQIASDLGYSSLQHFSNAFKKKFGYSPNKLL